MLLGNHQSDLVLFWKQENEHKNLIKKSITLCKQKFFRQRDKCKVSVLNKMCVQRTSKHFFSFYNFVNPFLPTLPTRSCAFHSGNFSLIKIIPIVVHVCGDAWHLACEPRPPLVQFWTRFYQRGSSVRISLFYIFGGEFWLVNSLRSVQAKASA